MATKRSIDVQELDGPRLVRREELAAARQLAATCFPGFVDEITAEEIDAYTPPARGGLQVICHQGQPVAQIGITHSQVDVCGSPLHVASIGGVCTHPDYRGLGLGTRLLAYCTRKLRDEGARLMLISGGRGLYLRAGCVTAGTFEYFALKPRRVRSALKEIAVRPATEADVPLCARLYQAEAVRFVRRVGDFAGHFRHREEYPEAEDWIVEAAGRAAAYLFLSVPWEYIHRRNAGVREVFEYAGSRAALTSALPALMAEHGLRELKVFVPWQDVDFTLLLQRQRAAGERTALPGHTMRVVNFPGLMADLRPYVEGRLAEDPQRGLRFEQEGDAYAIARGQERLELDGAAMTRLVMGAPEKETPACSEALGKAISTLFPLPSFLPGLNYR
jgi:predicted N-acetyltransferase YhbS